MDDDAAVSEPPSPKQLRVDESTRKYTGAAVYKSKFKPWWEKKWPFVKLVKDDIHAFHCTVCFKVLSCGH